VSQQNPIRISTSRQQVKMSTALQGNLKACNQGWHVPKCQHVSSLCLKISLVDLFIFIFEGSPQNKDRLVIKKMNE
jgi:hypothetical protein